VTFRRAIPRSCSDAISIEARRLASALGAARDLDVFEEGTLAPLAAAGHATRLVAAFERLATLRQQARQQAAEALSAPGYTVFVLHLLRWIDSAPWRAAPVPASAPASAPAAPAATAAAATPPGAGKPGPAKADPGRAASDRTELRRQKAGIRRFAAGTLDRRHRAVIAIGGRPSGLDAEARHELRIAVKKLRYAAESFTSLQGGKSEKAAGTYLAAMAWLQQSLGILNDMATGEALVAGGTGGPFDGAIDEAGLALLSGWRLGLCTAVLDDADRAWNRFREADRFW
jgi:CHAD domain-containing protein